MKSSPHRTYKSAYNFDSLAHSFSQNRRLSMMSGKHGTASLYHRAHLPYRYIFYLFCVCVVFVNVPAFECIARSVCDCILHNTPDMSGVWTDSDGNDGVQHQNTALHIYYIYNMYTINQIIIICTICSNRYCVLDTSSQRTPHAERWLGQFLEMRLWAGGAPGDILDWFRKHIRK